MTDWIDIALKPEVVSRSLRVALIVGTLLVIINFIDRFITGNLNPVDLVKIVMTYIVPYCVSTYASVVAIREKDNPEQ